MTQEWLRKKYFDWLYDLVCGRRYSRDVSYRKLLTQMHNIEFIVVHPRDSDRAEYGIDLRRRFSLIHNINVSEMDEPCSVLEMILALAIHCEESIMDDTEIGDRTGQWFWEMIVNLGLGSMMDSRYDEEYVSEVIYKFLYREYSPDGKGGLFTIKDCDWDLRSVPIWHQLCWYLDSITW